MQLFDLKKAAVVFLNRKSYSTWQIELRSYKIQLLHANSSSLLQAHVAGEYLETLRLSKTVLILCFQLLGYFLTFTRLSNLYSRDTLCPKLRSSMPTSQLGSQYSPKGFQNKIYQRNVST